jgi:hypothetical protein
MNEIIRNPRQKIHHKIYKLYVKHIKLVTGNTLSQIVDTKMQTELWSQVQHPITQSIVQMINDLRDNGTSENKNTTPNNI